MQQPLPARMLPLNSETRYGYLQGYYSGSTDVEARVQQLMPTNGTISRLFAEATVAPGGGKSWKVTLMLNGNPTVLTCTINDAETADNDLLNSVAVVAGDLVNIEVDPDGAPAPANILYSTIFTGAISGESIQLSVTSDFLDNTATEYHWVQAAGEWWEATENDVRQLVAAPGTFKKFYVKLSIDPGTAPDAYRFTIRLNGATVAQSLIVEITANDTQDSDLVHNLVVAAGDVVTLMVEPLFSPSATPRVHWGVVFVADTDGESLILSGTDNMLSGSNTEYNSLLCNHSSWDDEGKRTLLCNACTLKDLYIFLTAAPGAGKSRLFTVRQEEGATLLAAPVANAATTGSNIVDTVAILDGETIGIETDPTNVPTQAYCFWGVVMYIAPELGAEKTSSETGSGVDAKTSGNPLATYSRSEIGGGVEAKAANNPLATYSRSETGSGVEAKASENPLGFLAKSETGSGLEHILDRIIFLTSESGSGLDTILALLGKMSSETGSGLENSYLHILEAVRSSSDTGSGVDVSALTTLFQRDETGAGVEAIVARAIHLKEYPTGALDMAKVLTAVITGTGETGTGAEASLMSYYQKKNDSGSGVDVSTLKALFSRADTGAGAEAITLLAAMIAHDTGQGIETVLTYLRTLVDSGEGADVAELIGFVGRRMRMIVYTKNAFNLKTYTSETGK